MIQKNILFLLITFIFIGCDVPGKILIKNNLNEVVVVSYFYKGKSENHESKTYKINPKKKKYIILGFGTKWHKSYIKFYLNGIKDTINLKIGNIEYFCIDKKCKSKIFNITNRKSKTTMEIVIDSNLINEIFTKKLTKT